MQMRLGRPLTAVAGLFVLSAVLACGPFFPENALDQPRGILQPPLFHFASELSRLETQPRPGRQPGSPALTLDLEMAEMEQILEGRITNDTRDAWLESYRSLRRSMLQSGDQSRQKMQASDAEVAAPWTIARQSLADIIAPLPADVRLYLEGAAAWLDARENGTPEAVARRIWQQLLDLPPDQRRWRSTWAAWMLFRTSPKEEQGRWLAATRRLSRKGFADCLHLGLESTYILGRPTSDYTERSEVSALEWKSASLRRFQLGLNRAEENLRADRWQLTRWSEEHAQQVIADDLLRRAQLLHLVEVAEDSLGWEAGYQRNTNDTGDLQLWLASYEKAQIREQQEALWLAWIHYNAAQFDNARRWLKLAPSDDINALALRGKLAVLQGRRTEAAHHLSRMAGLLPESRDTTRSDLELAKLSHPEPPTLQQYTLARRHKLLADCAVVQLARDDFAGALETLLRTDYWHDAAYVAEYLLSAEELLALARAGRLPRLTQMQVPDKDPPAALHLSLLEEKYGQWTRPAGLDPFTYLVARRLAREGYFKDSLRLLPDDLGRALRHYADDLRRGRTTALGAQTRGEALWRAAQIERQLGMELFGFETAPDHASCGGSFNLGSLGQLRTGRFWHPSWLAPTDPESFRPVLPITAAESWRIRHYGPKIHQRFHYRYTAAEHAWQAASLLPDNTPETAHLLAVAGSWLKYRDPASADRFYKALVQRNPDVPLAREADRRRWFPPLTWEFDLELD
jgi:hypothetical protein